ncbi:hypothetical protein QOT17_012877 [Balamuthia mandrillaris]
MKLFIEYCLSSQEALTGSCVLPKKTKTKHRRYEYFYRVKVAVETAFPGVQVIAKEGNISKFEITLEDGTLLFSGEHTYAASKNLRDKYPVGAAVVQMLKQHLAQQKNKKQEGEGDRKGEKLSSS